MLACTPDATAGAANEARYLGVASCSSSTCHGAIVVRQGSRVEQNEYRIWSQEDKHSRAYTTLESKASQLIAGRMGLGSAVSAPECLACHSMRVPENRRGPGVKITDGIGCEACHGAASEWINSHYAVGVSHQDSIDRGLTKLEDPSARAHTCMPCHLGGADRGVTHKMMAAGHPRLSFELDTFTHLQPTHFRIDADYRERKKPADSATSWAVGQAASVQAYLDMLTRRAGERNAAWPEFALYDCFSCHHGIGTQLADSGAPSSRELGLPRLALPALPLYRAIVALSGEKGVADLDRTETQLRAAGVVGGADLEREAAALTSRTRRDIATLAERRFEDRELVALLGQLSSAASARAYRTYADAEQATMACQAVIATLIERGAWTKERGQGALAGLFAATESEANFRAARFQEALATLRKAL
jgi:hypothetical protein